MSIIQIKSEEEFINTIHYTSPNQYIFVDFYANWCAPCKKFAPKLEKLSQQYKTITFIKIDIEEVPVMIFKVDNPDPLYQPIIGVNKVKIENMLKMLTMGSPKESSDDF